MNVFVRGEDGPELVGWTSLAEETGDIHVVDLPVSGGSEMLRLVYEIRSMPCLTPEMKVGTERAVVLEIGQTPDFLPGWERLD